MKKKNLIIDVDDIKETKELKIKDKLKNIKKKVKINPVILSSIITFTICLIIFGLFYKFYLKELVIETTKEEVTITDNGIRDSVKKVYDSVVVIETYVKEQAYASGTGFVYKVDDNKGYILTNNHVIYNANDIYVTFTNKEKIKVDVVGADEYSDIAVLSVDKDKIIKVAQLGESNKMEVGDTTFAVGAPIDSKAYSWTVTRGILSGKNRIVEISSGTYFNNNSYVMEVLQTDAAINSGNSGGPLCNANGEVIGITNMKLSSDSIEGMGFAIPIETALEYANSFISGEKISRPYIGVAIYDATNFFGTSKGIIIDSVEKDSPADKAGLKSGDKILKVNDEEVASTSYFKYQLYKYKIGDEVTITYERDSKEKSTKVILGSSSLTT